jgi:hypothetical protein
MALKHSMNAPRLLLGLGATLTPLGVIVALVASAPVGGVCVIAGCAAALLGLHRFGRLGTERFPERS